MRITSYFKEVYKELVEKVSWPSWSELQGSATVVMVASAIISLSIFAMDYSFRHLMDFVYGLFY